MEFKSKDISYWGFSEIILTENKEITGTGPRGRHSTVCSTYIARHHQVSCLPISICLRSGFYPDHTFPTLFIFE